LLFQKIGGGGLHMFYVHFPNGEIPGVDDFVLMESDLSCKILGEAVLLGQRIKGS
jgi:hypothetical protein